MSSETIDEKAVFNTARKIADATARESYLELACPDNPVALQRIRDLLRVHQEEQSFLESPPPGVTLGMPSVTEQLGDTIGPYKLVQQIGEGGMGVVYMAEQKEPVKRRVALKIIKPGMDTRQVIARFEAERQALAMMDHPNIAKVLDAGATDTGRPYFVMELVKGIPITEYCDQNHLAPKERLELFVSVCQAVQHAHQKGIIHRDIKPTNILVAQYDDRPVPKVIDFGVAKAVSQKLTEKTMFTGHGQLVGTLEYMSPEQAQLNQLDIDTRSDIYSLGVLLYELLTGCTPFDKERLRSAAFDELLRIVREEEPPRPSVRLSTIDTLPSIAVNRRMEPTKLSSTIRGELDWIVMKALEKDRSRRYETAANFAEDVAHYLNDEPVVACPPSAVYRFHKFARRNKLPLAVVGAAVAALLVVVIGSTIAARNFRNLANRLELALDAETDAKNSARDAQQEAEDSRDREAELRLQAQKQMQIAQEQRERAEANFALARSAVDEFLNRVTENELLTVPGLQPLRQDLLSSALEFYDNFTEDKANANELLVELARAHYRIARIRHELGQNDESAVSNERAVELYEQLREGGNESLEVRFGLAKSYFQAERYDDTVTSCREILESDPQDAETRSLLASTYNVLATAGNNDDDIASALAYHQQALPLRQGLVNEFPDNPVYLAELGSTVNNLGVLLALQRKNKEALERFRTAVGYTAEAYYQAPQTITWGRSLCISLRNVAFKQASFAEQDAALQSFKSAVEVRRRLAFENPAVASLKGELYRAWIDLGNYQRELGRSDAEHSFQEAADILENLVSESNTPDQLFELAIVYGALATPVEGAADAPDEDELAEQKNYADLGMKALRDAIDKGYHDVETLQTQEYLAVLSEREDFRRLVDRLDQERRAQQLASGEGDTDEETLAARRQSVNILRDLIANDAGEVRVRKTMAGLLHSIGVIQTGLKQFDDARQSLREAVELRKELCEQDPQDLELLLNLFSTRIALGDLDWERGEFAAAHTRWKQYFTDSAEFLAAHSNSNLVRESRLAAEESVIYQSYVRLALWPLLLEFADRTVRYEREYQYGIKDYTLLQYVLAAGDRDATERVLRSLLSEIQDEDLSYASTRNAYAALIRTAAIADLEIIAWDQMHSIARKIADRQPVTWGRSVALAVAQYRVGQHADALETIRPLRDQHLLFLEAAVTERLGDHEGALRLWSDAQHYYQSLCADLLQSPPTESPKIGRVFVFAATQALRREACRVIHGGEADDPWQHLIQARGYRLVGETELSRAELAAAAGTAGDDSEVWLARARLFEQWDDIERAEADWQQVVSLAGDDPLPWIQRGRWYAEHGEQEKANADFLHATSVAPSELIGSLLRPDQIVAVWDFEDSTEGWVALNDCNLRIMHGALLIESTGNDPYMQVSIAAPAGWKELTFRARFEGTRHGDLFWRQQQVDGGYGGKRYQPFTVRSFDSEWRQYRVYFQAESGLTHLRLDPDQQKGTRTEIALMTLADRGPRDALTLFNSLIEANNDDAELYRQRGGIQLALGNQEAAVDDFNRALQLRPNALELLVLRAEASSELSQWKQAIADYSRVLQERTEDADLLAERGTAYTKLNEWERAIDDFNRGLALIPNDLPLLVNRASAYRGLKQHDRELADWTTLTELDSDNPWHWYYRGLAYCELRQFQRAEADLDRAIQLDANTPHFLHRRGNCYAQQAKWKLASDDKAKALREPITNQNVLFWCWRDHAMLRLMVGDAEGYRLACAQLLKQFGNTMDAVKARALVRVCTLAPGGMGDENEDRLIELAKRCDESEQWLAALHFRSGRDDEAAALLARQQGVIGGIGHIQAMADYRLGKTNEALKLLREQNQWMDETQAKAPNRVVPVDHWDDWVCRLLLRREAEQLIDGTEETGQVDKGAKPTDK